MDKVNRLRNFIIDNEIATEDETILVEKINGSSLETLGDIIYARTGLHSVEQLEDEYDTSDIEGIEW